MRKRIKKSKIINEEEIENIESVESINNDSELFDSNLDIDEENLDIDEEEQEPRSKKRKSYIRDTDIDTEKIELVNDYFRELKQLNENPVLDYVEIHKKALAHISDDDENDSVKKDNYKDINNENVLLSKLKQYISNFNINKNLFNYSKNLNLLINHRINEIGEDELVISNAYLISKYKNIKDIYFLPNDPKQIYRHIDSASFSEEANEYELFVMNDFDLEQVNNEILQLVDIVKKMRDDLNESLGANNSDYTAELKYKIYSIFSNIDSQTLLLNDVIYNIQYDWYSVLLDEDKKLNQKQYVKPTNFSNPIITNTVIFEINNESDYKQKVKSLLKRLDNDLKDSLCLNDYITTLKILLENNILKPEAIVNEWAHIYKFLSIDNIYINKIISTLDKMFYELKTDALVSDEILKKLKKEIASVNVDVKKIVKILVKIKDKIVSISNLRKLISKIYSIFYKINYTCNSISLIINDVCDSTKDSIDNVHLTTFDATEKNIFFNTLIASLDSDNTSKYFLDQYKKHVYTFEYKTVKIVDDWSKIEDIYSSYSFLRIEDIFDNITKSGIFYSNKIVYNIFVCIKSLINQAYNEIKLINDIDFVKSDLDRSVYDSMILSANAVKGKFLTLEKKLNTITNLNNLNNVTYIKDAISLTIDIYRDDEDITSNKLIEFKDIITNISRLIILSLQQLIFTIRLSEDAWKNASISYSINDKKDFSWDILLKSNKYTNINDYILKNNPLIVKCEDCKTTHKNKFVETSVLTSYFESYEFNVLVYNRINEILQFAALGQIDNLANEIYISNRFVDVLLVEMGIASDLKKVLFGIDGQITSNQLNHIFASVDDMISEKNGTIDKEARIKLLIANKINDIILYTNKLWLLRALYTRLSIINVIRPIIIQILKNPNFYFDIYNYLDKNRSDVANKIAKLRKDPYFKNNIVVQYLYCEFIKNKTLPVIDDYVNDIIEYESTHNISNDEKHSDTVTNVIYEQSPEIIEFISNDKLSNNYNDMLDNINRQYIYDPVFVSDKEFLALSKQEKEKNITFKDILNEQKSKAIFEFSLDYYDVRDYWLPTDFAHYIKPRSKSTSKSPFIKQKQ